MISGLRSCGFHHPHHIHDAWNSNGNSYVCHCSASDACQQLDGCRWVLKLFMFRHRLIKSKVTFAWRPWIERMFVGDQTMFNYVSCMNGIESPFPIRCDGTQSMFMSTISLRNCQHIVERPHLKLLIRELISSLEIGLIWISRMQFLVSRIAQNSDTKLRKLFCKIENERNRRRQTCYRAPMHSDDPLSNSKFYLITEFSMQLNGIGG